MIGNRIREMCAVTVSKPAMRAFIRLGGAGRTSVVLFVSINVPILP
jgi:hypothetical protein